MNDFLRVLGDDPAYKGRKAYCYVHRNSICRIYPVYAEVTPQGAFQCTDNHPKAQIYSYTLIDVYGNEYSCGKKEELEKLGLIEEREHKGRIGFVTGEDKKQYPIDTENDIPDKS